MERQPTQKQLAYIRALARKTNTSLYLGSIKTIGEASKMIDDLKQKANAMPMETANQNIRR